MFWHRMNLCVCAVLRCVRMEIVVAVVIASVVVKHKCGKLSSAAETGNLSRSCLFASRFCPWQPLVSRVFLGFKNSRKAPKFEDLCAIFVHPAPPMPPPNVECWCESG